MADKGSGKAKSPRPEPRLEKRVLPKPDGRYLILYEPKKPRDAKG